jgi:hypothetical protein
MQRKAIDMTVNQLIEELECFKAQGYGETDVIIHDGEDIDSPYNFVVGKCLKTNWGYSDFVTYHVQDKNYYNEVVNNPNVITSLLVE